MKRWLTISILILLGALAIAGFFIYQREDLIRSLAASFDRWEETDLESFTEATLERVGGFASVRLYKVTLRKDGSITYIAGESSERPGKYRAQSDRAEFHQLARLIKSQGYFKLRDNYSASASDLATAITSVVLNNNRKTVVNYGGAAPIELWGIEMAIDAIVAKVKLEKE